MAETIGLKAVFDVSQFNKGLSAYNAGLGKANAATTGFTSKLASVGKFAAGAAVVGIATLGAGIAAFGVNAVKTSISFESAFAGVVKTTDGLTSSVGKLNEAGLALRQEFTNLSKEVPLAFEELARIGELGGQLGIGKESLIEFTETVAALGVSTNLSTEEAATGLARMSNIFAVSTGEMGANISQLGSTIVALGNNFATTERDILAFGERIAGAGKIAGFTQADVLSIGAALSSVGVEAEAGGTAVQKVMLNINNAVNGAATGFVDYSKQIDTNVGKMSKLNAESARLEAQFPGLQAEILAQKDAFIAAGGSAEDFGRQLGDKMRQKALEVAESLRDLQSETNTLKQQHGQPVDSNLLSTFAQTANLTSTEFQQLWEKDASEAFTLFVEGLGAQGDDAVNTLEELGLSDQRLIRSFLSLSGAGDLLSRTLELGNTAFEENTALAAEAAQRYATTESKIAILKNTFRALSDAVGFRLLPVFNKLLTFATDFIKKFEQPITRAIDKVSRAFDRFGVRGATVSILSLLGFEGSQISEVTGFVDGISSAISKVFAGFRGGGGTVSILSLLGFDAGQISEVLTLFTNIKLAVSDLINNIVIAFGAAAQGVSSFSWVDLIANSITFINQNFEMFKNIVLGIGTAFAGIAIAGTIAGIIAAINPLTLAIVGIGAIIGVVATAWTQNWGNIQAVALTAVAVLQAVWAGIVQGLQPAMASFQQLGVQLQSLGITWPVIWQAISTSIQIVGAIIGAIILGIISLIVGIISAVASVLATVIPIFTQLTASFQTFAQGVVQIFQGNLFEGIMMVVTGLGEGISTLFLGMFTVIIAATQGFIDGIVGFWQGLYQTLIGGSIVPNLVNGIVNAFVQLSTNVLASVSNMVNYAIGQFTEFINKAQELFSIDKFIKMGEDVIKGLVKGIKENANKVISALGDVVQSAIDAVLDRLGISSPSTVFTDIGTNMIDGLIIGLKSQAGTLNDDISSIADAAINAFGGVLGKQLGNNPGMRNFREFLHKSLQETVARGLNGENLSVDNMMASLQAAMMQNFDGAIVSQEMANQMAGPMFDAMSAAFGPVLKRIGQEIATKLASSAGQFLSLGQTVVKRMIGPLEEKLAEVRAGLEGKEPLAIEVAGETSTVEDVFSRLDELRKKAMAGQLTEEDRQERARLLEAVHIESNRNDEIKQRLILLNEQQIAEDRLSAAKEKQLKLEKQQADLQFLQQQLGLLSTIQELGLDPAEILKGIKLGLDADLGALADAMGAVVQSIIDKVDDTLQIASPSKVMAEKGQQVVSGLMQGMQSYASNLKQSVGGLMQGGLINGANASTQSSPVTNNNNRSVSIGPIYMQDNGMTPQQLQQFIRRTVMNPI